MGRLDVHISHGHNGPDLSGLAVLVMAGFAVAVAAELIASVIWWLIAITATVTVAAPAAGVLTWRATRHREARFAAQLAAARPVPAAPPARALPAPAAVYHLHFHGINPAELTSLPLPPDAEHHPGRTS